MNVLGPALESNLMFHIKYVQQISESKDWVVVFLFSCNTNMEWVFTYMDLKFIGGGGGFKNMVKHH